jgi:nitroreductase
VIIDLLKKRFSVREFIDKPIPDKTLGDILEAGRLSPSGGNEQPWIFGVITDRDRIARIAQIAHRQMWIARAPLLVVLCTTCVGDERGGRDIQVDRFPEYATNITEMDQDLYWALNMEEHQTKIAGTHMAMVALEHGVGACWVSRFEVQRLAVLLNLPAKAIPSEILAFGYPVREREPTAKKDLDQVVFYDEYGR